MSDGGGGAGDPWRLAGLVRDVPDFPEPGILFKDITPLLADGDGLGRAVEALTEGVAGQDPPIERVAAIEARGFIVGAALAVRLGVGLALVRKAGKLPWHVEGEQYDLEYGSDRLETHRDAVRPGERVLVVDDVLATGGTAAATARLVARLGGEVVGFSFLVELGFLGGRERLPEAPVRSLIMY